MLQVTSTEFYNWGYSTHGYITQQAKICIASKLLDVTLHMILIQERKSCFLLGQGLYLSLQT